MSIKDDLKLRLSEEITFNGDGYDIMCGVIDDFFESKFPKSYAESEKLFLEWWHTGSRADTLSRKNMQLFYEIVVGNNGR